MRYLFYASGENVDLAKAELMALLETYNITGKLKRVGRIFVLESNASQTTIEKVSDRLVLFRKAGRLLFETTLIKAQSGISSHRWKVKMPYAVRVVDLESSKSSQTLSKSFGDLVGKALLAQGYKVKVDLNKPKTTIQMFLATNKLYVIELFWSEKKGKFELREPMKRPAFHPSSLRPKFASLLVNLSGLKSGERFLDPFCGMGGILIEAGLLEAKLLGVDFDESALRGATKNLDFFRVKDFDLKQGDSASMDVLWKHNSIDAIATDPPYGRSSHVEAGSIKDLYESVLDSAWHLLKHGKRMAVIHPNNIKLNITRAKYDIVARGEWYVHGGLTRKILVLRKL